MCIRDRFILEPSMTEFYDSYLAITTGCGCSKKARIRRAKDKYFMMANLNRSSKAALRGGLEVNEIVLKDDGKVFAKL